MRGTSCGALTGRLARGALAGAAATLPMTAVFAVGKVAGLLHTPPPKQIAAETAEHAGVQDDLTDPLFTAGWLAAHLAYGVACGALYAAVRPALPRRPARAGLVFGAAVWAASYGVLMPALRLYPPPGRDAPGRIAVTALAHAVYGLALAGVEVRARPRAG